MSEIAKLPDLVAETFDRVLVADTDMSGRVYFDRFYARAEAGYGDLVRAIGGSVKEHLGERFVTPAVSSRCDYFAAVEADDLLRQYSFVSRTGTSSTTTEHHFINETGVQVATVQLVRAIVDRTTAAKAPISQVLAEEPDSVLARLLRAGMEIEDES